MHGQRTAALRLPLIIQEDGKLEWDTKYSIKLCNYFFKVFIDKTHKNLKTKGLYTWIHGNEDNHNIVALY